VELEHSLTRTATSPVESQDADLQEPGYMESVRRYHELAELQRRQEWIDYHNGMSRLHEHLAQEHAAKAAALAPPALTYTRRRI
jgi:hypothetical protein